VTSKTRRNLLDLLWLRGRQGTVSELAREAGAAFSSAHRELEALARGGVVVADDRGGRKRYAANASHPLAPALRQLLAGPRRPRGGRMPPESTEATRRKLAFLGAPLVVEREPLGPDESAEDVLLEACRVAHLEASVTRVLPFVFARLASRLNLDVLRQRAKAVDLKHTVGFMLDLAGQLGGNRELSKESVRFLDRRLSRNRAFFAGETRRSRVLAEKRSPDVARRWGWRMNMGLDSFASVFEKFPDAAPHA